MNSARNCLRYIIRAYGIKKLHTPYYTCPEIWTAIESENCQIIYYEINDDFMPKQEFKADDFILYTNYFGVCSKNVKLLFSKYKNLIIDNAQAFFFKNYGIASFYSPRKFFGIADGGIVICNKNTNERYDISTSYQYFSHLIKRVDSESNFAYNDFQENEIKLGKETIKKMSNLTDKMLRAVNYKKVKIIRLKNFTYLKNILNDKNELNLDITDEDIPMYYPFLYKNNDLRRRFIENKIYVACCWKNIQERINKNIKELYFQQFLFPLPIDQRYNISDMKRIISIVNS